MQTKIYFRFLCLNINLVLVINKNFFSTRTYVSSRRRKAFEGEGKFLCEKSWLMTLCLARAS